MAWGPKSKKRRARLVRLANRLAQDVGMFDSATGDQIRALRGAEDFVASVAAAKAKNDLGTLSTEAVRAYKAAMDAGY